MSEFLKSYERSKGRLSFGCHPGLFTGWSALHVEQPLEFSGTSVDANWSAQLFKNITPRSRKHVFRACITYRGITNAKFFSYFGATYAFNYLANFIHAADITHLL